jgi:hypothetical protein
MGELRSLEIAVQLQSFLDSCALKEIHMRTSVCTWNTQGNPCNDKDKYEALMAICCQYDVVLLQECGALVYDSIKKDRPDKHVLVSLQAGAGNIRCSTAIVVDQWQNFDEWPGSSSGRSGIWIHRGDFIFATIHCTSGGFGMADLDPFAKYMAGEAGDHKLVIGGDFNCEFPAGTKTHNFGTRSRPVEFAVHTQKQETHKNRLILDHFVSRNATIKSGPRRYKQGPSDHHAVTATFA